MLAKFERACLEVALQPVCIFSRESVTCEFGAFDLKSSCIDSRLTLTIKLSVVLALILLSSLPRRLIEPSLLFLFVIIRGGLLIESRDP